jgi:glycosyltransferase involved in cell wall biosynthesis
MQEREIKIYFLMESFSPIVNGAVVQVMLLGEKLAKSDFRVTVLTRQTSAADARRENLKGIDVLRVKPAVGLHRLGKYLMIFPALFELIKQRDNWDIVIVCDMKVLGIVGVVASKLLRKKCLLRAESCGEMDGTFATQFGRPPSKFKLSLIGILVRLRNMILLRADGFISISSVIKAELLNSGVAEAIVHEIPNGIDTEVFTPVDAQKKRELKSRLALPNKRVFLYTGRLAKGKGLEHLLEVWKKLVVRFPEIHLVLVGGGQGYPLSCEHQLKDFVRKNGLVSTVCFPGNVKNVNEYLQASDFFILPSQIENVSLSLIEALSSELPCIASSVGGILDIIDDEVNGILVPYGDEDRLYRAMEKLLQLGNAANQFGREGRRTVERKFDVNRIAAQYSFLSKELLGYIQNPTRATAGSKNFS